MLTIGTEVISKNPLNDEDDVTWPKGQRGRITGFYLFGGDQGLAVEVQFENAGVQVFDQSDGLINLIIAPAKRQYLVKASRYYEAEGATEALNLAIKDGWTPETAEA